MPSALLDRLQRILPFADKVADEIVCEETDLLKEIIPRTFERMQWVAKFVVATSNVGVSVRSHRFWIWKMLMIAERVKDGLVNSKITKTIEGMDGELTKVFEDFDRAVNVEALRLAKETGKYRCLHPAIVHPQ